LKYLAQLYFTDLFCRVEFRILHACGMVWSSGAQPFQTRGPLGKFCLGSWPAKAIKSSVVFVRISFAELNLGFFTVVV